MILCLFLIIEVYLHLNKKDICIEKLTRLSQCLNAKTGFVIFLSVYQ